MNARRLLGLDSHAPDTILIPVRVWLPAVIIAMAAAAIVLAYEDPHSEVARGLTIGGAAFLAMVVSAAIATKRQKS